MSVCVRSGEGKAMPPFMITCFSFHAKNSLFASPSPPPCSSHLIRGECLHGMCMRKVRCPCSLSFIKRERKCEPDRDRVGWFGKQAHHNNVALKMCASRAVAPVCAAEANVRPRPCPPQTRQWEGRHKGECMCMPAALPMQCPKMQTVQKRRQ